MDSLESFRIVLIYSGWSGKLSGQPGKFSDSLDIFQMVWKVSEQPGKFPDFLSQIQLTQAFCCKNDLSTLVLLQKQFTHTFLSQKLFMHFFVTKRIYAYFFVAKTIYALFLSRKRFTHFVWKVFARLKLPSGKFRLFGPLR